MQKGLAIKLALNNPVLISIQFRNSIYDFPSSLPSSGPSRNNCVQFSHYSDTHTCLIPGSSVC